MACINEIKQYLKSKLDRKRYVHSVNASILAAKLARRHHLKDAEKIELAALLHDLEKDCGTGLTHSGLSAAAARKTFGVTDKKILDAIKYHTVGSRNMDDFAKVVYLSDIAEPSRKFREAAVIRRMAFENIDEAMIYALAVKMKYVLSGRKPLAAGGVALYNKLIAGRLLCKKSF
jgi:HD superfamily phosphohydrolase YqeK